MKNKKTPLMHKYHPGGYIGWGLAIIVLIILTVFVTMYVLNEQDRFKSELSGVNSVSQDVVERNKIRSISERLGAMKDEISTITWNEYLLGDSLSMKYPEGYHLLTQDYFEPYGQQVVISKDPLAINEGELNIDQALLISQRLIVDVVDEEATARDYIGEELLDLNEVKEEEYTSASELTFMHISGEPKIAAELDQPSQFYTLLYADEEGQLYHLLITAIEPLSEPAMRDFVDTIELGAGFRQA